LIPLRSKKWLNNVSGKKREKKKRKEKEQNTNSNVLTVISAGSVESIAIRDMATNYKNTETEDEMRCVSLIFFQIS